MIHKDSKETYYATNKKESEVSRQIVAVRSGAEEFLNAKHNRRRRMFPDPHAKEEERHTLFCAHRPLGAFPHILKPQEELMLLRLVHNWIAAHCNSSIDVQSALQELEKRNHCPFETVSRVRIQAKYDWMEETLAQTIYAYEVEGENCPRYDFIQYEVERNGALEIAYGQAAKIFKSKFGNTTQSYVLLVRQMADCAPAAGNTKAIRDYGMTRLAYCLNNSKDFS